MKNPSNRKERRTHPRIVISLPANFELQENESGYPGLTIDVSQSGLLIQTLKDMPVGITLNIEILSPENLKPSKIRAEAKIIWKDVSYWEDWEGYQYGLMFTRISNEDCLRLSRILKDPSCLQEIYFAENRHLDPKLIVKTR